MRTRSFRNEDYNNRRAFLRSYPLYGGGDQDEDVKAESEKAAANETTTKKPSMSLLVFLLVSKLLLLSFRFSVSSALKAAICQYLQCCVQYNHVHLAWLLGSELIPSRKITKLPMKNKLTQVHASQKLVCASSMCITC